MFAHIALIFRHFSIWCIAIALSIFSASAAAQESPLEEVLFHINHFYVEEVDRAKLDHHVLSSLLSELDPYSEYLDEKELKRLFDVTNGEYKGLGIEVEKRQDHVVIVSALPNSPAQAAGLLGGDILLAINDVAVLDKSLEDVSKLINSVKMVRSLWPLPAPDIHNGSIFTSPVSPSI
ncbi:S41 family peptidase [Pseudoalteromonas sp. T1lg75]|uniref:S41 family peptidase n=1 Tax=Pseudoalteromonas sp. T1lg75 TaxID=2077102 RepID=UPI000CF66BA8|nr:PDZ domain-containing protein [Pseudoalteromonas sp. T1lg75]